MAQWNPLRFGKRSTAWLKQELQQELSYPVTRPYDISLRHFKAIVLSCFGVLLVALTIFNYANVAFSLQPSTSLNPNRTEEERHWFMSDVFTFGDDKLKPKCQAVDISIGDEFITSNLGPRYKIDRVIFDPNGTRETRTSVAYRNNKLNACHVDRVELVLSKEDSSNPAGMSSWISWHGSSATASVNCTLENKQGIFEILFHTRYSGANGISDFIAASDAKTHASLWWGVQLMSPYFLSVKQVIAKMKPEEDSNSRYRHAVMRYNRSISEQDIDVRSKDMFSNWFWFLRDDGHMDNEKTPAKNNVTIYNNTEYIFSRPLTEGFYFANVFRSTVLADLGGENRTNLVLNETLLEWILNPNDDFNRENGYLFGQQDGEWWRTSAISPPSARGHSEKTAVAMHEALSSFGHEMGNLTTKPATIHMQYTCQVPEKKSAATAVLFTVVATMSLMQAAWAIFKWIVEAKIVRGDRDMWCQGCHGTVAGFSGSMESASDTEEMAMLMTDTRAQTV